MSSSRWVKLGLGSLLASAALSSWSATVTAVPRGTATAAVPAVATATTTAVAQATPLAGDTPDAAVRPAVRPPVRAPSGR